MGPNYNSLQNDTSLREFYYPEFMDSRTNPKPKFTSTVFMKLFIELKENCLVFL